MKFGVAVEAPIGWEDLLALAREVDQETGYAFFWISDSLIANGLPDEPRLEAWTALAAIAGATSRVRLGVLVSGNAYRHPALLAKMATTVDHISGGRVELGLGAGWPGQNRRYGIDFWKRPERIARFEEAVTVIRKLWTESEPTNDGPHYPLDAPPWSPANVQQPHPPILLAGGRDETLRVLARHADAVNPMIDVAEARAKLDACCRELGRDPGELRWTQELQLFLNDDPTRQRAALEVAKQRYGMDEPELRRTSLFGSLDEVRAAVARQRDLGVEELYVFQLPRVHRKSLLRFSDEIIPEFT